MTSGTDRLLKATPPRMLCKRYHADVPVATCLARRKKALAAGPSAKWGSTGAKKYDPGCVDCEQGKAIANEHGDSVTFVEVRTAPRKPVQEAAPIDKGATVSTKTCGGCGEDKPLEDFRPVKLNRDGRDGKCRVCINADQKRRYLKKMNIAEPAAQADSPAPPIEGIRAGVSGALPAPTAITAEVRGNLIVITIDCAEIMDDLRAVITASKRR